MTTEVLSYTISAGQTVRAPRGRLFFVKTAANPLSITASGRPGAPIKFSNITAGLKYGPVDESEHWEYLEITSATAQTIEIIIGDDDVEVAGTVSVAGTVTVSEPGYAGNTVSVDISVPTGVSTAILAPSSSRKTCIVGSLSTNPGSVRIGYGGAIGATQGIELQPGEKITIPTQASVYAWNANATACAIQAWDFG